MPMPSFLSSLSEKAQSKLSGTPLGAHLHRPTSPDASAQPTANQAAAQGGSKSHAFEAISHQFRSLQQQYTTTSPVQKIITAEKGIALNLDNLSRDSKAQSKELYTWGQSEADDLKDVSDRLAFLNFVNGSLTASLAEKLDAARNPLKVLRNAEAALEPRRTLRANITAQIARLEHDQNKANDRRMGELQDQLRQLEYEDQSQEREIEILKRKALRESEQLKWEAIREYAEKLALLSQAAPPLIAVLPAVPLSPQNPYTGAQTTGAVRASLQRALDNYKTGHINLPPQLSGADLSRSDTRSFGESHASELSSIVSPPMPVPVPAPAPAVPHAPTPAPSMPVPAAAVPPMPVPAAASSPITAPKALPPSPTLSPSPLHAVASSPTYPSPPIDPAQLNQAPAPLPPTSPPAAVVLPSSSPTTVQEPLPTVTPTIAETGLPVSAGPEGPGPSSGSLARDGPSDIPSYTGPDAAVGWGSTSAADEKKRLAAQYAVQDSQASYNYPPPAGPPPAEYPPPAGPPPAAFSTPFGTSTTAPAQKHESAEEEKKRLEREERDRVLHAGGSAPGPQPPKKSDKDDELPPAYQEPGL